MGDTFDLSGVLNMQRLIDSVPRKRDQVIQRTISNVARRLPVEARRDMQTEVNLAAARISDGLSVTRDSDSITLTGSSRGIGLVNVPYKASKDSGVTANAYVQAPPVLLPHAFVAAGASGNKQVFQRINGAAKVRVASGKYAGQLRQPIAAKYAPSVASQLRFGEREDRLADFSATILHDESERLLDGT